MRIYNYTSLQTRDTKIYNVGGINMSGGMSVEFLKVVGPVVLIAILLGFLISIPFGIDFFNPFGEHFVPVYTIAWLVIGVGVGMGLWKIQFAGFRLYQYLLAYIKPKKVYGNDFKHTIYKLTNVEINTFVKNIF